MSVKLSVVTRCGDRKSDLLEASSTGVGRQCRADHRRATAWLCGASLLALSVGAALADTGDGDHAARWYVGGGLLASHLEPDTDNVAGTSVDQSTSGGLSLTLGRDVHPRFSVEAHLALLGEATLEPTGSIDYTVGGLSALIYAGRDAGERARRLGLSLFARLGLGALDNDASGVRFRRVNDVHLLAGVGMEYGLASGLGLRAELVAHETDAKYAQLGLVYRFGDAARPADTGQPRVLPNVSDIPVEGPVVDQLPQSEAAASLSQPATAAPADSTAPIAVDEEVAPPVGGTTSRIGSTPARADDTDGDGVDNARDRCANTEPGIPVRDDGCAVFGGVMEGIGFEPDSDRLTAEAMNVLAEIATILKAHPDIRVVIEAHTDSLGSASGNLLLSRRRAIAVTRYLVDAGIAGSRLRPQAYGESRPVASNRTSSGRAANRRVEFSILK